MSARQALVLVIAFAFSWILPSHPGFHADALLAAPQNLPEPSSGSRSSGTLGEHSKIEIIREETVICGHIAEIEVRAFDNLTIQFARAVGAQIIVRGLRAVADFEYEFQMTAMNQQLDRDIETVFLMADPRHQAIASRLVKDIVSMGGDVSRFVPAGVARRLAAKYGVA